MKDCNDKFISCPINYTLSIVGGKWKWAILWIVFKNEVIRYGKLKENLSSIAHKTLSQQLKELEDNQLIIRKQYNQIPPKVEYSLSEKGETLIPILNLLYQWGEKNISK